MASDHREDDAIERTVRLLEQERGLRRLERAASRDMRDLRHEPSAEVKERLCRLAQRQAGSLCFDAVLTTERLGLGEVLLLTRATRGVEMTEEKVAHAHPALAEPAQ